MKRRRYWIVAIGIAVACLAAARLATASCIAISNHVEFVECRAVIAPPFTPGTVYVIANLFGDAASNGVTGAEFRVDGFPSTWFPIATPNPQGTANGDPFGAGCAIAFSSCQNTQTHTVLLYTIAFFPTDAAVHDVHVLAATPPYDPQFDCPVLRLCDAGNTRLCVTGGFFRFNNLGPCEVSVQPVTWSSVKALFE